MFRSSSSDDEKFGAVQTQAVSEGCETRKSALAMSVTQLGLNGLPEAAFRQCHLAKGVAHALKTNRRRRYRGKCA